MFNNDLPTTSDFFQAYYDCRKTKRMSEAALAFEENLERNIFDLYYGVLDGTYTIGSSVCFVVEYPKVREIWAANFPDRVIHHLIYNRVKDVLTPTFITDSYACIPKRGVHKAVSKLEKFSRSITQNYTQQAYVLQIDIANFFVSIDKQILDNILTSKIPEGFWLNLIRQIIHHDPTVGAVINSNPATLAKVPKHKSLFYTPAHKGMPIGNLSSQFFANAYLNLVDQFVKHQLKVKYYIRYVDDMVLMSQDKGFLISAAKEIGLFLQHNLKLHLHPNKTNINHISKGFNALGYIIRPYCKYVRNSVVKHGMQQLEKTLQAHSDSKITQAKANSLFNLLSNANAFKQRQKVTLLLNHYGYYVDPNFTKVLL